MKTPLKQLSLSTLGALALAPTPGQAAVLLAVDFGTGTSPIATTFLRQSASPATHPTTEGNITVTVTGIQGFYDRGASAGAANDLYRDFIFQNTGGFTIALSGAGIDPSTAYELTFYSYDSGDASRSTTISGSSGTTGTPLGPIVSQASGIPDTMGEYARTGTLTSSASSTLTFSISGSRTAINGFQLSIPEPSATLLGGMGLLLLLRRHRA